MIKSHRSPERLEGKCYGFEGDIWSLGMVAFEMTTGIHPYPTSNPYELLELIRTSPSPSITNFSYVSANLSDFISKW